jgi:MoaA/NifB/PqqE/SkfB family radical SAM enzyme
MLGGINEHHIEEVVKKVSSLGAYISNIMQLIPVKGSAFENLELVSNKEIMAIREKCAPELRQMYHCRQCRADAVGTLDNDRSIEYTGCGAAEEPAIPQTAPVKTAQKFAVASKSGMLVDQHFGKATEFYIYESDGRTVRFLEKRLVRNYCSGPDDCDDDVHSKIETILSAVSDCQAVLALRTGDAPSRKLEGSGIRVISTYDRIEDAILKAAASQ